MGGHCIRLEMLRSSNTQMGELEVQRIESGHAQPIGVFKVFREGVLTEKSYTQEA